MAEKTPATDETTVEDKKTGRPANQVTATLKSSDIADTFNLTRRALGLDSAGDAVRLAVDEFNENHKDERERAVEFFGW